MPLLLKKPYAHWKPYIDYLLEQYGDITQEAVRIVCRSLRNEAIDFQGQRSSTAIDVMLIQNKAALVTGAWQAGRPAALRIASVICSTMRLSTPRCAPPCAYCLHGCRLLSKYGNFLCEVALTRKMARLTSSSMARLSPTPQLRRRRIWLRSVPPCTPGSTDEAVRRG